MIFICSWPTKRVISWSSLDWDRGRWNQLDLVIGTLFDTLVHLMNAWFLAEAMSWTSVNLSLLAVVAYTGLILFNPFLAWSSFREDKENIPDWIRKKVKGLTPEQRNELQSVEKLAGWLGVTGERKSA